MHARPLVVFVVALGAAAACAGCGPGKDARAEAGSAAFPTTRPIGAATPEALLARVADAYRSGDRDEVAACYARSTADQAAAADYAIATFEAADAVSRLRAGMDRRFGPGPSDAIAGLMGLPRPDALAAVAELFDDVTLKVEGDRAFGAFRSGEGGYTMVRQPGGGGGGPWLLDASPPLRNAGATVAGLRDMTGANRALADWARGCVPLLARARDADSFMRQATELKEEVAARQRGSGRR